MDCKTCRRMFGVAGFTGCFLHQTASTQREIEARLRAYKERIIGEYGVSSVSADSYRRLPSS